MIKQMVVWESLGLLNEKIKRLNDEGWKVEQVIYVGNKNSPYHHADTLLLLGREKCWEAVSAKKEKV